MAADRTVPDAVDPIGQLASAQSAHGKVASMGLAWSHCVNTRISMTRRRHDSADLPSVGGDPGDDHRSFTDSAAPSGQTAASDSKIDGPVQGRMHSGARSEHRGAQPSADAEQRAGGSGPAAQGEQAHGGSLRRLELVWSPWAGPGSCEVDITSRGVVPAPTRGAFRS